jgi:tetratricopeptide (TPR) repeat protein
MELHRRIGEALEALHDESVGDRLAELAHHFYEAAWAGQHVDKAVQYSLAAAEDADRRFAFEDAVKHYERALQALELDPAADEERRCDILLALGDTQWRSASTEAAKTTFEQAGTRAQRIRSPERMARAALGFGGRFAWVEATGAVDFKLVELLQAALDSLPAEGSEALRARLLGRLATQLYFSPEEYERAHEISREAVELARRSGDVSALAYALNTRRFVMWGRPVDAERLALSREILDAAQAAEDTELTLRARGWLIIDYLELSDVRAADRETRMHAALTDELRQPLFMAEAVKFRAVRALMEGRLVDADALGQEFVEKAQWIGDPDIAQAIGIHMFLMRGMQARSGELEVAARSMAEAHPRLPAWQCGLAFVCGEIGKEDEARRLLDAHIGPALGVGGHAGSWVIGACVLAELAAAFADRAHAERLYEAMAPFSGTSIVIGYAAGVFGAADRTLGLLATTLGRFDDAQRHLEAALELNSAMGAKPFVAWTKMNLAMLGLTTNAADQPIDALLHEARALSEEVGTHRLTHGANELLARRNDLRGAAFCDIVRTTVPSTRTPVEAVAAPAAVQETTGSLLIREGEYWTVGDEAAPFRLKDSKGLRHLALLLSAPDTEWYAADLVAAESGSAGTTIGASAAADAGLTTADLGDAGAALDEQAKAAYRTRIDDLREELEEAESFSDPERASAARAELEFVTQELSAAVGLGGRDRKAASASERARVNVTRALRAAVARIREHDEALGHHLESAVKTGTFCSYAPEPWSRVEWRLEPDVRADR